MCPIRCWQKCAVTEKGSSEEQNASSGDESANELSVEGKNTDESNGSNKAIIKERSKTKCNF